MEHGNINTAICKIDKPVGFAMRFRELKPVLCDNLGGWDGV